MPQPYATQPAPSQQRSQSAVAVPATTRPLTLATASQAAVASQVPAPKFRAKGPEEPRQPKAVRVPTPEELGLAPAATRTAPTSAVDWNATRARLRQLGASAFQLDQLSAGVYRFSCWMGSAALADANRVSGEGASEAEAVQRCLEKAARLNNVKR